MTLIAMALLFTLSTAQACHAHDSLLQARDGHASFTAPVDECPLCASPHLALPAEAQIAAERTPQMEPLALPALPEARCVIWPFGLFSRPPPAGRGTSAPASAGIALPS